MITASIPAASAVLKIAPIFPGFSGDSATSIKGFFGRINWSKWNSFEWNIAKKPSPFSLYDNSLYSFIDRLVALYLKYKSSYFLLWISEQTYNSIRL